MSASSLSLPGSTVADRAPLREVDGQELKKLFAAGALWLEHNAAFVNSLNVFPVPDGDTGTNMQLSMQAAIREADAAPTRNAGDVAAALARGALLGARGNSGVILSQVLRGIARVADRQPTLNAQQFADALAEGSRTAYKGVVKPVEGTILTVIREASERALQGAAQADDFRFVLECAVQGARDAVRHTPDLLPVLKEAGVVDAGGEGLALVLEGAFKYLRGDGLEGLSERRGAQNLETLTRAEGWGYDIQFHIRGNALDIDAIRETIASMGESALIVGDAHLIKVHVHAPNPGDIIRYGAEQGALINIIIENMQEQYADFMAGGTADRQHGAETLGSILPHVTQRPSLSTDNTTGIATIAVTSGEGLSRIFESLGISAMVSGGPSMNPSAQDLLKAIETIPSEQVILLPNDKNIILAAEQMTRLSDKQVRVIPTRSVPQGIASLLAFNYQADLDSNVRIMTSAVERIRTIELTYASRTVLLNGISVRDGQPIALLDGALAAAGDELGAVMLHALHIARAADSEVITLYYGSDEPTASAVEIRERVRHQFPAQEIELHAGGQPFYPYIVSIE